MLDLFGFLTRCATPSPVQAPLPKDCRSLTDRVSPRKISVNLAVFVVGVTLLSGSWLFWVQAPKVPHPVIPDASRELSQASAQEPQASLGHLSKESAQVLNQGDSSVPHATPRETLSEPEKEAFYGDIDVIFGSLALATVNPQTLAPHLSRLNARGPAGLKAIAQDLGQPASSDVVVKRRMYLIDYVNYRMAWDPESRLLARALVQKPIPRATPLRYQATSMIEKAEILAGLAAQDADSALSILKDLKPGRFKNIATNSVRDSLLNHGRSLEEVQAIMQK